MNRGEEVGSSQNLMFVLGLLTATLGFIGMVIGLGGVLAPKRPSRQKNLPYECGMEQAGQPHAAFNVRFSTIALLFVLFDAESILLFAVATRLHGSLAGLIEAAAFTAFLAFGLFYAWKKGALQWH